MQPHQEIVLKQVWAALLKTFGYEVGRSLAEIQAGQFVSSHLPRRSRSLSIAKPASLTPSSGSSSSFVFQGSDNNIRSVYFLLETGAYDEGDDVFSLYHQEEHPLLAKYVPEELHKSLWASSRNESPDNNLLRFLRLSNFDFKTSLKWIAEVGDWRHNKYYVDDWLYKGDADVYFEATHTKLIETFHRNEVYIHGYARDGSPLVVVRVKEHFRHNCPDEDYEKFILMIIEWARLNLLEYKKGVDRAHVLFDMSGFTMKNADFHAVKFLVKAVQRCYPDCIEAISIHKAPRIFQVMWNIIVKWMKPHLKERFIFTNTLEDLSKSIETKYIPKLLGGANAHIPAYIEPTTFNCQPKEPDALFENLMKQRDELTVKFIDATIKWIEATTPEESKVQLENKIRLAKARAQNYVFLDPYVRLRGVPDRNGAITSISF